jgi:hypothetical protein
MKKKPDKADHLLSAAILATPLLILLLIWWNGTAGMKKTRESIRAGMPIEEVTRMFGQPVQVVNQGDQLRVGRRSYELPQIDEHTAVHVYGRDGIPYYNIYVFVDKRRSTVLRSEIENLWW